MGRAQRVGVLIGVIVLLGVVGYVAGPFASCESAKAERLSGSFGSWALEGPNCAKEARPRLYVAAVILVLDAIGTLAAVKLLAPEHDVHHT